MNTMIRLIFMLFFILQLQAQNADVKTKKRMNDVKAKYEKLKYFKVDFTLVINIQQANKTETEKGTMIQNGKKFYINQKDKEIINDSKTQWLIDKEAKEVQITNAEANKNDNVLTPNEIFSLFEKDFLSIFFTETYINKIKCSVIDMTPINKDVDYYKIRVWINTKDNSIQQLRMFTKDGNQYTCTINSFVTNASNATAFTFDKSKYPSYEIVDLR